MALDSGEDGNPSNDNLTTLVRLCRIDLGVRIQINTDPLRMSGDGRLTSTHVVIGRVRDDDVDRGEKEGMLVYVKISLTGGRTPRYPGLCMREIRTFPTRRPTSSNRSTRSGSKAYRNLGDHIARRVFQGPLERSMYEGQGELLGMSPISTGNSATATSRLFGAWWCNWSVPPALQSADYIQGTRDWIALQRDLLKNETLAPLAYELYPEFVPDPGPLGGEERYRAERAAFHAVGVMTQIMESTWVALKAEFRRRPAHESGLAKHVSPVDDDPDIPSILGDVSVRVQSRFPPVLRELAAPRDRATAGRDPGRSPVPG